MFSVLLFLTIGGCAKTTLESKRPIVQGHRISGVSQQPLQALKHAQKNGYPSIEIDVSLTSDMVLIIHHDYWLSKTSCTQKYEDDSSNQSFIKDHTWEQLNQKTTCPSRILSVEEFLSSDMLSSKVLINLDIKYHPKFTHPKERFIQALLDLTSRHPDRNLMLTTSDRDIVQHLKKTIPVPVLLEYPFFSSTNRDHHNIMIALHAKIKVLFGVVQFVDLVKQSNADGISLPFQIVARRDVQRLNEQEMMIQLFTVNDRTDAQRLCSWPIDILISDSPESMTCFRPLATVPSDGRD